jgi:hypothetical protein
VVAAVTGFVLAHAARRWQQARKPQPDAEDWQVHALDGAVAVAPMILVVILLLLGRGAFSMLGMRTRAIDTVVQLATALVLVRIAVYLLGVLVGPQSWFRRWENRITWGLAVTIGFELIGWFTPTQRLLDSINLLAGQEDLHAVGTPEGPGRGRRVRDREQPRLRAPWSGASCACTVSPSPLASAYRSSPISSW